MVLRKSFYIRWSAGRSPRVHEVNPGRYPSPSASIDEEYGMINYPHAEQMPFHIPYQMQKGFQTNMWVNLEFPIHGEVMGTSQDIYAWHVRSYNQYYRNTMSWYDYCLH